MGKKEIANAKSFATKSFFRSDDSFQEISIFQNSERKLNYGFIHANYRTECCILQLFHGYNCEMNRQGE
jgi:hypothetical protein